MSLSLLIGEIVSFLLFFEVVNVELDLVFGVFEKGVNILIELTQSSRESGSGRGGVILRAFEFDVTSEPFITFVLFQFFLTRTLDIRIAIEGMANLKKDIINSPRQVDNIISLCGGSVFKGDPDNAVDWYVSMVVNFELVDEVSGFLIRENKIATGGAGKGGGLTGSVIINAFECTGNTA